MMMISNCLGVLRTDKQTDERTDIGDCRVAFATENQRRLDTRIDNRWHCKPLQTSSNTPEQLDLS